ncbi:MAG: Hsp20/alpha crystallin family protein [Candidatus Bathyarchaeia archaeon]
MMKRKPLGTIEETISLAVLVIGLLVIGILLAFIVRFQRGLLGVILAVAAALLLFYWLRELRKTAKKEWLPEAPPSKAEWTYDLVDRGAEIAVIAEVPGPEEQISINIINRTLEIRGGGNFYRQIKLPEEVGEAETTYHNGVLQVILKRKQKLA